MTATDVKEDVLAAVEALSKLLYHEPYFVSVGLGHDDAGAHVELHVRRSKLPSNWRPLEWPTNVRVCTMLREDEVEKK